MPPTLKPYTGQLADKTAEHAALTSRHETLTADLNATTERLTNNITENETLTADLNATTERLTNKIAENETLTADLQTKERTTGE